MDFQEKRIHLFEFLDDNYVIKEQLFFTTYEDIHEWGEDITALLSKAFFFDSDFCKHILMEWSSLKGLTDKDFENAWRTKKLRATWTPEMVQDLQAFVSIDAEAELTAMLADRVAQEIDAEILRNIRDLGVKKTDDLLGIVKCLGHEATEPEYDKFSGRNIRGFKPVSYQVMKDERENNNIWKNYFRPTRPDEQT